jgi:hypothetical protein
MTPADRTLAALLGDGALERVPKDHDVVRNLLRQAGNHLGTAAGGAESDPEGAFQLAYDGCRKMCLALVLATGIRPRGEGHHAVTFEAATAIAASFGERQLVRDAGQLRYVRNGAEYRAETVSAADVDDAIAIGKELRDALAGNIDKILRG